MRAGAAVACVAALEITACNASGDIGYVEIKTVPVAAVSPLSLYLDSVKLDPVKNGSAVLRQQVGTAKLEIEADGSKVNLCNVIVKKNRITSVTVSVLSRPPRCQCGRNSGVADAAGGQTCLS